MKTVSTPCVIDSNQESRSILAYPELKMVGLLKCVKLFKEYRFDLKIYVMIHMQRHIYLIFG